MSRCAEDISRVLLYSVVAAGWVAAMFAVADEARAEVTDEQRREVAELKTELRSAGSFFQKEEFEQSGEAVKRIQERATKLADGADADLLKILEPVFSSLKRAHALLELEGVELPTLKIPGDEEAKPSPAPGNAPSGGVSFVREVAPILIAKCGGCHVRDAKGGLSMANFAALMQGSRAGKVVFPGDDVGSPLIETIESGDMPRGGTKIAAAEVQTLKKWVAEGAKYDHANPNANLASIAGAAPAGTPTETSPTVTTATGNETISFARDLAPVLIENCSGCHIGAQRPQGQLNMSTFTLLMRGGDSGEPVAAGKPADSLLIQKLKGTAGERMPAGGRPPLSDDVIAKFETWIQEGAKFDGADAGQQISSVAALAKASASTHEQLSADRVESAQQSWRLGMPGIEGRTVETENFYLIGSVGENTLAEFGRAAEATLPQVAAILKTPTDKPLVKGRMTLFVFEQRYDYSEFGKMVERRSIPTEWRGHWTYNVVDAYGALVAPKRDEYGVDSLIAQHVAGIYLASLNKDVPRWFSEGTGRLIASRVKPEDPRVVEWNSRLANLVKQMSAGDDFLEGKTTPEDADIASYSFVEFLSNKQNAKRWDSLLTELRAGKEFTPTFSTLYGGSPRQVADPWWRSVAKGAARSK